VAGSRAEAVVVEEVGAAAGVVGVVAPDAVGVAAAVAREVEVRAAAAGSADPGGSPAAARADADLAREQAATRDSQHECTARHVAEVAIAPGQCNQPR
jgi:hypothetical protein